MTEWNKYFRMMVRKKWLVIFITLLSIILPSYISFFMIKPQYEASTKIFCLINSRDQNNSITYDNLMAAQLFIKNYNELIKSRAVTSEVIKNLKLTDMTEDDLVKRISVDLLPNSSMMVITAKYGDPDTAVAIANEVSEVFILKAAEILMTNNVSIVDRAIPNDKPVYPKPFMFIGFGFLSGIMLSLALVLVLAYFDDVIGNSEEVEKKTGLHVVGVIPDMKVR